MVNAPQDTTTVRLPRKLAEDLRVVAAAHERSLSAELRVAVAEHVRRYREEASS